MPSPASLANLIPATPERGRMLGLRSAEARRRRRLQPDAPLQAQLDYGNQRRLARVRKQADTLLTRIEEELAKPDADGMRVDRLANALWRLSELERYLAGRPAPGNLRPSSRGAIPQHFPSTSSPFGEPEPTT